MTDPVPLRKQPRFIIGMSILVIATGLLVLDYINGGQWLQAALAALGAA